MVLLYAGSNTGGTIVITTARYTVSGMTCGHCTSAVTEELQAVDGVQRVEVDLVAGGESTVTVISARPLAETAVQAAVEEAGYAVTGGTTS
jgi:copper chaperone